MLRNVSFDCIFYCGTSVRKTSSSEREPIQTLQSFWGRHLAELILKDVDQVYQSTHDSGSLKCTWSTVLPLRLVKCQSLKKNVPSFSRLNYFTVIWNITPDELQNDTLSFILLLSWKIANKLVTNILVYLSSLGPWGLLRSDINILV